MYGHPSNRLMDNRKTITVEELDLFTCTEMNTITLISIDIENGPDFRLNVWKADAKSKSLLYVFEISSLSGSDQKSFQPATTTVCHLRANGNAQGLVKHFCS